MRVLLILKVIETHVILAWLHHIQDRTCVHRVGEVQSKALLTWVNPNEEE